MMAGTRTQAAGVMLSDLLTGVVDADLDADCLVSGLTPDSRHVRRGDLFIACGGQRVHGAQFAAAAVRAGAAAVLWEPSAGVAPPVANVPVIAVPGLRHVVGRLADRYYGEPSAALSVAGVTGTNGKTSCAFLIAWAASSAGRRSGFIGTLGTGFPQAIASRELTTPDVVTVHRTLAELRADGAAAAAMEVSSHALDQGRVDGVRFDTAVFTNLSRDHLDYHGDFARYGEAKERLFAEHAPRCAVINVDDEFGAALAGRLAASVEPVLVRTGEAGRDHSGPRLAGARELVAEEIEPHPGGLRIGFSGSWGAGRLCSPMIGRFNATNLLSALAVLLEWGVPLDRALAALESAPAPAGRMQRFGGAAAPLVIVDYAHTPDALAHALRAVREHCEGRVLCVFGCGGERDAGKRPMMGAAAAASADELILTDDNPRGEDPAGIVADIVAGVPAGTAARVEHDRRHAIEAALSAAGSGDAVLIAGKGHETCQDRGGQRLPFDDAAVVRELLEVRQ